MPRIVTLSSLIRFKVVLCIRVEEGLHRVLCRSWLPLRILRPVRGPAGPHSQQGDVLVISCELVSTSPSHAAHNEDCRASSHGLRLPLQSLRILHLPGNEITKIEGLSHMEQLRELVLDKNKVEAAPWKKHLFTYRVLI